MLQVFNNNKLTFYILLFLLTCLLRFPYHYWDTISIDENVFLLLGDLINKGEKPHHNFWDIKPALIWYFYSIPIFISKNIFFIRFFGTFVIFISSLFLFEIILRFGKCYIVAFASAMMFVMLSCFLGTELPNHQIGLAFHLVSEHITNFFFLIFFFYLQESKKNNNYLFLSFVFFSLCILARYNYIVCSFVFLIYLYNEKYFIKNVMCGTIIFTTIYSIVHYSFFNEERINDLINYYKYLINYGSMDRDKFLFNFLNIFKFVFNNLNFPSIFNTRFLLTVFVWIPYLIFVILFFLKKVETTKFEKFFFYFGKIIFISIIVGESAEHYLIQIVPFISYFSFKLIKYTSKNYITFIILIVVFFSGLNSVRTEYQWLLSRLINKHELYIGPTFEINKFLVKNNYNEKKVFYLNYPLGYFLNNQKPIHKLLHPTQFNRWYSIISKNKNRSDLYQDIFNSEPEIVILDLNQWNVINNEDVKLILDKNLNNNYRNIHKYKSIIIFKKLY